MSFGNILPPNDTPVHSSTAQSPPNVVERLRAIIAAILDPLTDERPFAIVDFPDHSNVGDSAIWLGEIAYFRDYRKTPAYVCTKDDANWLNLEAFVPDGPIYIHGGGNFGDIWSAQHDFRLQVLRRFPSRLVVQLPQSIQFSDERNIAATQAAIAAHGNFVLLVRDQASFTFASKYFSCRTLLCPDMAFCLGMEKRRTKAVYDELNLLRTDIERVETGRSEMIKPNSLTVDWLEEPRWLRTEMLMRSAISGITGSHALRSHTDFKREYFRALAQHRMERGLKLLSTARHITTDRLHAHILSTLLNIPHTVLDNSYGKIGRFMQTWGTNWCGVEVGPHLTNTS